MVGSRAPLLKLGGNMQFQALEELGKNNQHPCIAMPLLLKLGGNRQLQAVEELGKLFQHPCTDGFPSQAGW